MSHKQRERVCATAMCAEKATAKGKRDVAVVSARLRAAGELGLVFRRGAGGGDPQHMRLSCSCRLPESSLRQFRSGAPFQIGAPVNIACRPGRRLMAESPLQGMLLPR